MKYSVQFDRYFEEFDWIDCDTKEFDSLTDAYRFFNEMSATTTNVKLYIISNNKAERIA